jgi:hypothetical protein
MRIRSLHPTQWTDEEFVTLTPMARLLALGLRNEADDQGIFEWKPTTLKMRLLPADSVDMDKLLAELADARQVCRFELDGRSYGAIRNFKKYQKPKRPRNDHTLPPELRDYVDPPKEPRGGGGHAGPGNGAGQRGPKEANRPTSSDSMSANPPPSSDSMSANPPPSSDSMSANRPLQATPFTPKGGNRSADGEKRREEKGEGVGEGGVGEGDRPAATTTTTRLPDDWTLPDEWAEFARNEGLSDFQVRRQAERFLEYWQDATRRNWRLTWRNWILNEVQRQQQQKAAPSGGANPSVGLDPGYGDRAREMHARQRERRQS